jgi:hypothetical protein
MGIPSHENLAFFSIVVHHDPSTAEKEEAELRNEMPKRILLHGIGFSSGALRSTPGA